MNFETIHKELDFQGRKKTWLIKQIGTYPVEYYRVVNNEKDVPLGWAEKISSLLNIPIDKIK